jgi:hypothetical protein
LGPGEVEDKGQKARKDTMKSIAFLLMTSAALKACGGGGALLRQLQHRSPVRPFHSLELIFLPEEPHEQSKIISPSPLLLDRRFPR